MQKKSESSCQRHDSPSETVFKCTFTFDSLCWIYLIDLRWLPETDLIWFDLTLIWFCITWPHGWDLSHCRSCKIFGKHYVYVFAFHWAFDFMASSAIFFDLSPFSMHSFIIRNPMTYFRTRQWWDQIFFIKTDDGWQVVF